MLRRAIYWLLAMSLALCSLVPTAAAAQGASTIHGFVSVNGSPASAGTQVDLLGPSGTLLGSGLTGVNGLAANQYRIDVQATPALENQNVTLKVPPTTQSVVVVFRANLAIRQDLSVGASPVETVFRSVSPRMQYASAFNYTTQKYEGFVPGLAGNPLSAIGPNSVIIVTMLSDSCLSVSGVTFNVKAMVPTPIPVGASVAIGTCSTFTVVAVD